MKARLLLLDAGNTRLKWAVYEAGASPAQTNGNVTPSGWLGGGATQYAALDSLATLWQRWGGLSGCFGVNVAGAPVAARIAEVTAELSLQPVWLSTGTHAGGVSNCYCPPEALGSDRWMGLLAARQRTREAVLVVSAGSAMTVDALDAHGHFLGGLIVPGLQLMRESLARATAQVGYQHGANVNFPRSTADAVETGLQAALSGAIETMRRRVQGAAPHRPACLLTGGDAQTFATLLEPSVNVVPDLILEGVAYMALKQRVS